jgi:hypothetical protein
MTHQTGEDLATPRGLRHRLRRSLARWHARVARPAPARPVPHNADDSFAVLTTDALAASGAWVYETDAHRILRRLSPITTPAGAALIGRDIRSLFDPLSPLGEHARIARAFETHQPFSDLLMPLEAGGGRKLLRVSGAPFYDGRGVFRGYRGLAIDAEATGYRPDATVALIAPDLRHALVNVLGVIVGFGQLLQDELPAGNAQQYVARVLLAAATARNIVAASTAETGIQTTAPVVTPLADWPRPRVLVVHQLTEVGDLLSIAFDRAGFESAVCRDADEALEILAEDASLWDVLITDAANAQPGETGLLARARAFKDDLLRVVCDEPGPAALAEADADLCWPRPTDPLALVRMVEVQLGG